MNASSMTSNAPMRRTRLRQREQMRTRHDASVRIVGVHDDREIGGRELIKVAHLADRVPGQRGRASMFRVGRTQQRCPTWRHQRRHLCQQDLRPGRRDDMCTGRRAIGARRRDGEPLQCDRFRQAGEYVGREPGDRVGMRIDPGREVDKWFGGAPKQQPRRGDIAAVRQRREHASASVMTPTLALLALLIELMLGYPDWTFRTIGHPVTWIGRLIDALERTLNRDQDSSSNATRQGHRRSCHSVAVVGVIASLVVLLFDRLPFGFIFVAALASTLLAQRSLYRHVADVAAALERHGLEAGRKTVARIVGRDPQTLDEAGVARAAIESLAENFSDGVVAPALWMAIAGLPGAAIYKAINTADSMIGHMSPRYRWFGWAAARLDDLVNLPASRMSAALIIAAAALTNRAVRCRGLGRGAPRRAASPLAQRRLP